MTGAPIPVGADAVVMVERTELHEENAAPSAGPLGTVTIADPRLRAGQNITRQGVSLKRGAVVLQPGAILRAIEIGLLAEVGRTAVRVIPRPTVAVLATGNELVPPEQTPGPGQIRNSNAAMLAACVTECGAQPVLLGVGRDERDDLRERIARGLTTDVLVVSGGVSAGRYDLVPEVLAELGVRQVFHKLRLKPGKPLWFGVLPHAAGERLVFGLPGNPVSSYVCCQLFVRPAIARLAGRRDDALRRTTATLGVEHRTQGDRLTYHPARVECRNGEHIIISLAWQGSGDLAGLSRANALACFPAGEQHYAVGEQVEVCWLE